MKSKIKVNSSLKKKLARLSEIADDGVTEELHQIADTVINVSLNTPSRVGGSSFVRSGAYITSFSFNVGAGRPRGYTLHGRPQADPQERANVGRQQLTADIDRIQYPSEVGFIQLRNNAPHARSVEKWYRVFGQVSNIHG
tara:strand:+ start:41 stop:460 length:420 start_codon:yes stop_codon:yes gene_type:complete